MKIGIITIQKCNNFGADLQAFALQKKLQLMGYDAENIDYLFYKHPRHQKTRASKPSFKLSAVNRVKEWLLPKINAVKGLKCRGDEARRRAKFAAFFETHVKSSREYRTIDALYADPPKYDVYVTGSDQVWNPRMGSSIEPYFLSFAPPSSRKISYAASFGVSSLPPSAYRKYSEWLADYAAISTREDVGAKIVSKFVDCHPAQAVLDPTLLLSGEEWSQIVTGQSSKGDYLLVYDLSVCPGLWMLAKRWASELNVPIKRICRGVGCEKIEGVENLEAVGPDEFVSLVKNAKAVVTTSFHGTAFSVNFQKPFYSVVPNGMTNASRIESLLANLGLEERIVREHDVDSVCPTLDGCACAPRLEDLRTKSLAWLVDAIEGRATASRNRQPLASYAAWARDGAARARGTSGGAFGALAELVLKRGGIVFGAAWNADFRRARHIGVETLEGLEALKKSKYVWSDPSAAYKEIPELLKNGREVLFVGTPCQCAALRSGLRSPSPTDYSLLTTVDFVCHGTPDPQVFAEYAEGLERKYGSKLVSYDFRDKRDGWNFQRVSYRFANGVEKRVIPWLDPYFRAFSKNTTLREGCFKCPFAALSRPSDLTIADCWRVAASNPEWDDNRGTSNVLVNTERGAALWADVLASGTMESHPYDLRLAQMRNHSLMEPSRKGGRAKPLAYYWLQYWVKRIGWFYFRRHQ